GLIEIGSKAVARTTAFVYKRLNVYRDKEANRIARGSLADISETIASNHATLRIAQGLRLPARMDQWPISRMIRRASSQRCMIVTKSAPQLTIPVELRDIGISMPAARALHRKGIFYPDQIAHEDGRGPNGVHFRNTRGVSSRDIETIYSYFHRTPRAEILQQKKDRSLPLGLSEEQLTRLRNTFRSQRRISGGEHILVYTDGGYDPDTMRGSYGVAFISHNHIE